MIFIFTTKITALLLAYGITFLLEMCGYKLMQAVGAPDILRFLAGFFLVLPWGIFFLNIYSGNSKSSKKKMPPTEREKYESFQNYRQRICDNYEKESKKVLFKFKAVNFLFVSSVIAAMASAFFGVYAYGTGMATLFILYDAAKRLIPYPSMPVAAYKLPRGEYEDLRLCVSECAKKMHCRMPDIYLENTERITFIGKNSLIIGTYILPHLNRDGLCLLICHAMKINKLTCAQITCKKENNKSRRGFTALFSVLGGRFYDVMTECDSFLKAAPYAEALIADKAVTDKVGIFSNALGIQYVYHGFTEVKDDPELLELLFKGSAAKHGAMDRLNEKFRSYVDIRHGRIMSMLESTLVPPYAELPPYATRLNALNRRVLRPIPARPAQLIPQAEELAEKAEIFNSTTSRTRQIFLNRYYDGLESAAKDYERSETASRTAPKLIEIAYVYSRLGRANDSAKILRECMENGDSAYTPRAKYLYGKLLLDTDDSDGIEYIVQAAEECENFSYGYEDICRFAARFGMDKTLSKYTELFLDSQNYTSQRDFLLENIDRETPIYPTSLSPDESDEIAQKLDSISAGSLDSAYMVRGKYGEGKEVNIILVLLRPNVQTDDVMIREAMKDYVYSRPDGCALIFHEDHPLYIRYFLMKAPDCMIFKKH